MKKSFTVPFLLSALLLSVSAFTQAQGTGATRQQIAMERDAFLAMAQWDAFTGMWVLKPGMELPSGVKSRADVIAMRDRDISMSKWDAFTGMWVALKTPRDMSQLTREQVEMETARFVMMHRFDEYQNKWVSRVSSGQ